MIEIFLVIFSWQNIKQGNKHHLTYLYACWINADEAPAGKYQNGKWPEKLLISGSSGNQYVSMVTELLSSF